MSNDNTPPHLGDFNEQGIPAHLADDTFIKYHLAITQGDYARQLNTPRPLLRQKLGHPESEWNTPGYVPLVNDGTVIMQLMKVEDPTYEFFMHEMEKVGGKYGWHLRQKYQGEEGRKTVNAMLSDRETTMYTFQVMNVKEGTTETVGFTLIAGIDPDRQAVRGIGKNTAINRMITKRIQASKGENGSATKLELDSPRVEIYKFGIHDSQTGRRYGHYFLPKVLEKLFKSYDIVYLDTRSTNPPQTIDFYKSNGLAVIHDEELPSDIIPDASIPKLETVPATHPVNGGSIKNDQESDESVQASFSEVVSPIIGTEPKANTVTVGTIGGGGTGVPPGDVDTFDKMRNKNNGTTEISPLPEFDFMPGLRLVM